MVLAQPNINSDPETWFPWIILVLSILVFVFPRTVWFFQEGWKFRQKLDPSWAWLASTRLGALFTAGFMVFVIFGDKWAK